MVVLASASIVIKRHCGYDWYISKYDTHIYLHCVQWINCIQPMTIYYRHDEFEIVSYIGVAS